MNYLDFDIYAKRVGFFFQMKQKIGSYFGLFLTLSYIIISIVLFIYCLICVIQRTEIKVYDSTLYAQEMPIIDLDKNSFYFAFGLEEPNTSNRFVDESIYYTEVLFIDRVKENGNFKTVINRKLELEKCKEINFGENYQHLFIKGELLNSYCLKDFDYNLTFAGGYKYEKMTYIRIKIFPCVNTTENNNHCKPQEEIDFYFTSGYFSILLKDIGLNPSNYSYPIIPTLQDLYTTVDRRLYRNYILNFGITEIHTDTGLFNENIKKDKYIQFRKELQNFSFRDESDYKGGKEACIVQIRLDDTILIQKRAYTKISEILSRMGGYMQLMNTVFLLVSILINKINSEIKIVNSIFNFDLNRNKITLKYNTFQTLNTLSIPQNKGIITTKRLKNTKTNESIYNKSINNLIIKTNSLYSYKMNDKNKIKKNFSHKLDINKSKNNSIDPFFNKNHKSLGSKLIILKSKDNKNKLTIDGKEPEHEFLEYKENKKLSIFDFIFYWRNIKKNRIIDLYNLGNDFYKRRMDLILIFSHLLLTEKILIKNYNNINSLYKEIKI